MGCGAAWTRCATTRPNLDQDGLTNLDEFRRGEPQNPDTDADRLLDGEGVNAHYRPAPGRYRPGWHERRR